MDIYLNKNKLNTIKSILSTGVKNEETMEMIVPDALPDILRIVDADAIVFLRSKATDSGHATVSGVASATVLYSPEGESGVRKMELDIPFTAVASESEITNTTRIVTRVSVSSVDASMINPRKIIVRIDLLTMISCYNEAELQIAAGIDEEADAGIELMTQMGDINTTTGVNEKAFVIANEIIVPNSNPPVGEILKYTADLIPEDTKVVGSKLILRGTTHITLLYNTPGNSELTRAEFNPEFSQIIELDGASSESNFTIMLMLTNAYFDADQTMHNSDGRTIVMELHAVAQCITSERKEMPYISDMYSTKYKLEQTLSDYMFDSNNTLKMGAIFHGILETPTPVSRVVAVSVHTGAVLAVPQQEGTTFTSPLFVNAMYVSDDGRLLSAMSHYEVETNVAINENAHNTAVASCGKDVYGVAVSNAIELRIPIEFVINENEQKEINSLDTLSYDEDVPLDLSKAPSLIVHRAGNGDSLWNLAKRHQTTSRTILTANGLDSADDITYGQLLIIPKSR